MSLCILLVVAAGDVLSSINEAWYMNPSVSGPSVTCLSLVSPHIKAPPISCQLLDQTQFFSVHVAFVLVRVLFLKPTSVFLSSLFAPVLFWPSSDFFLNLLVPHHKPLETIFPLTDTGFLFPNSL